MFISGAQDATVTCAYRIRQQISAFPPQGLELAAVGSLPDKVGQLKGPFQLQVYARCLSGFRGIVPLSASAACVSSLDVHLVLGLTVSSSLFWLDC